MTIGLLWASTVGLAPLLIGLVRTTAARLQGRIGPSVLQPYFDLWKLLHKQAVWPETASLIFGLAPYLNFIVYALLIGFILQSGTLEPTRLAGSLLTIIFCLALARFVAGLAALDTGTPLAALGHSRALFLHVLTEPTVVALAYAVVWHTQAAPNLATVLIGLSLLGVSLQECSRLPFDNPDTKLELTMNEAAGELDYSGLELAVWEWANALRLACFVFLFSLTVVRFGLTVVGWWALTQFVIAPLLMIGLAFWEATRPRTRLRQVVGPAAITLVLAFSAVLLSYVEAHLK